MSGRCTICTHADRPRIDLAIASGISHRRIGERHKVSSAAVWRHSRDHLSPEIKAALALKLIQREGDTRAVLLEEGAGVAEALRAIRAPLFGRFLAAVDTGDDRAASALSARLHEGLSITAKLTGELMPAANITNIANIVLAPDYQRFRGELLTALQRYPEAAAKVADLFRRTGERAAEEMTRSMPRPARMIEARVDAV